MHYYVVVAIGLGLFSILSLSLNIITGYAGQPTLGHAAFYGVGAYATALLTVNAQWPLVAAVPAAALAAALIGLIAGAASLRVREDFLAITTMGVNFVAVAVFHYTPWFGGALGMGGIPAPPGGKPVLLAVVWGLTLATAWLSWHLERSWAGMGLKALRDDDTAAEAMGVDTRKMKLLAFVLGCGLAGMAGSLYAQHMSFISAQDFGFPMSMSILTMAVFGGLGTIRGAIGGALVLGLLPELFRFISDYRMLVYGGVLVLMMLFRPTGLLGTVPFRLPLPGRERRGAR